MRESNAAMEPEASPLRAEFDRARFLRLLGMGAAGLLLPPALSVSGGRSASAAPALLGAGKFPIGVWWPPPPSQTTRERYAEISRAGFNFVIGGNRVVTEEATRAALGAAAANGLRFLVTDRALEALIRDAAPGATSAQSASEPETPDIMRYLQDLDLQGEEPASEGGGFSAQATSADVRRRVERLLKNLYPGGRYPALAGLNLYDEPPRRLFSPLKAARDAVKDAASNKLSYITALPSYATRGARGIGTYERYLERYMSDVKPPLLSFSHYPLLKDGITRDYFYNWAQIRKFALKFGVPSWVFIQSVGFDSRMPGFQDRRKPNEAEIRWQVNVSLAYGAKGIQYFSYWTPTTASGAVLQFGQAMLTRTGDRTKLYDHAKNVNGYLRVVGRELLPLVSEKVAHARERQLPYGAKPFKGDGYVKSAGGSPLILGRFRKNGQGKVRYLLAANRSPSRTAKSRLKFAKRVRKVLRLDVGSGRYARVALRGNPKRELAVKLPPGGGRLYLLRS